MWQSKLKKALSQLLYHRLWQAKCGVSCGLDKGLMEGPVWGHLKREPSQENYLNW